MEKTNLELVGNLLAEMVNERRFVAWEAIMKQIEDHRVIVDFINNSNFTRRGSHCSYVYSNEYAEYLKENFKGSYAAKFIINIIETNFRHLPGIIHYLRTSCLLIPVYVNDRLTNSYDDIYMFRLLIQHIGDFFHEKIKKNEEEFDLRIVEEAKIKDQTEKLELDMTKNEEKKKQLLLDMKYMKERIAQFLLDMDEENEIDHEILQQLEADETKIHKILKKLEAEEIKNNQLLKQLVADDIRVKQRLQRLEDDHERYVRAKQTIYSIEHDFDRTIRYTNLVSMSYKFTDEFKRMIRKGDDTEIPKLQTICETTGHKETDEILMNLYQSIVDLIEHIKHPPTGGLNMDLGMVTPLYRNYAMRKEELMDNVDKMLTSIDTLLTSSFIPLPRIRHKFL